MQVLAGNVDFDAAAMVLNLCLSMKDEENRFWTCSDKEFIQKRSMGRTFSEMQGHPQEYL